MLSSVVFVNIILFSCIITKSYCYKSKYEVEAESIKLYGMKLNTVLEKFRKTRDYQDILQDKMNTIPSSYKDISIYSLSHHYKELQDEVNRDYGKPEVNATGPAGARKINSEGFNKTSISIANKKLKTRRSGAAATGAQILDKYDVLNSPLTVKERNTCRGLGFEYAGKTIHSIIKHMNGENGEVVEATIIDEAHSTTPEHTHLPTEESKVPARNGDDKSTTPRSTVPSEEVIPLLLEGQFTRISEEK